MVSVKQAALLINLRVFWERGEQEWIARVAIVRKTGATQNVWIERINAHIQLSSAPRASRKTSTSEAIRLFNNISIENNY